MAEPRQTERKLRLRVVTPLRVAYDGLIDLVVAKTTDGDMGVMYGHEPCTALLGDGALRIIPDQKEHTQELLMVFGGILTIRDKEAVVMSDIAEPPDQLQAYLDRLLAEKEENLRREQTADLEALRMERAIRQALVHVDISPYIPVRQPGGQKEP